MKSISLAILCYHEKNITEFGYHYNGSFFPKVLLLAYSIDNEDSIHIVDLTTEKLLPPIVFARLRNPKIVKYTYLSDFTRECLVRNFNYNFSSANWKSLYSVTSYLRMPDTLEELSALFGLKTMDFSHIEYCKNIFCLPHTVTGKEFRIYPVEYPTLWKHMKEYCKWLVETEQTIRHLLYKLPCSDVCHLSSALRSRICKKGVPINHELLEHHRKDYTNQLIQLCSDYQETKDKCRLKSSRKYYNKLLAITHSIENLLKRNYDVLKKGISCTNIYHEPFTAQPFLDIPKILYDVAIPIDNHLLVQIDFTPFGRTIRNQLADNFHDKRQLLRAVKYVLYTKHPFSLNNITLDYHTDCLCVYADYDSVITYSNVSMTNNDDYLFSYSGYTSYCCLSTKYCTLDNFLDDIVSAIQTSMIATLVLQYETNTFNVLSFSKNSLLLSIPYEKHSLLQEVFNQCHIQTRA